MQVKSSIPDYTVSHIRLVYERSRQRHVRIAYYLYQHSRRYNI